MSCTATTISPTANASLAVVGPSNITPATASHHVLQNDDTKFDEEEEEFLDSFGFSFAKAFEYAHDNMTSTLRNPKLVLGVAWNEGVNMPVLEGDVHLKNVSVLKVSVWPRWTLPFVDVKVQTPASKAFQSILTMLATSTVVSSATRNLQGLSFDPLKKVGSGLILGKGVHDVLSYGKPLLLASAPLPVMMLLTVVGGKKG